MQAKARLQLNIQMNRVTQIPQTANLTDVLIPILWFEDVGSMQFCDWFKNAFATIL